MCVGGSATQVAGREEGRSPGTVSSRGAGTGSCGPSEARATILAVPVDNGKRSGGSAKLKGWRWRGQGQGQGQCLGCDMAVGQGEGGSADRRTLWRIERWPPTAATARGPGRSFRGSDVLQAPLS